MWTCRSRPAAQPVHSGEFHLHRQFHSRFVAPDRDVLVWLPPGYHAESSRRFPVLYLQDGQNLFNPETAFVRGQDWRAHETAAGLIVSGAVEPLILVGIDNTGVHRVREYTPVRGLRGEGGKAASYLRLLIEEVKPLIDRQYRTLPEATQTGVGGSSLGGLFSLYAGLTRPDAFGKIAAMSPSIWWGGRDILRRVKRLAGKSGQRIWLDTGTAEGAQPERTVAGARALRDALCEKGWRLGEDLQYLEVEGAGHDERSWGARVEPMLRFLYPAR
jgi:predicted alpha/beta superfamily hydrolase